jgi:putative NADH-flavin reductase
MKMTTLVVGASGATGRLLVGQLCNRGQNVRVIVRSPNRLPETLKNHDRVTAIYASILELSDAEMSEHVSGCDAVASYLGHNISFKVNEKTSN